MLKNLSIINLLNKDPSIIYEFLSRFEISIAEYKLLNSFIVYVSDDIYEKLRKDFKQFRNIFYTIDMLKNKNNVYIKHDLHTGSMIYLTYQNFKNYDWYIYIDPDIYLYSPSFINNVISKIDLNNLEDIHTLGYIPDEIDEEYQYLYSVNSFNNDILYISDLKELYYSGESKIILIPIFFISNTFMNKNSKKIWNERELLIPYKFKSKFPLTIIESGFNIKIHFKDK